LLTGLMLDFVEDKLVCANKHSKIVTAYQYYCAYQHSQAQLLTIAT